MLGDKMPPANTAQYTPEMIERMKQMAIQELGLTKRIDPETLPMPELPPREEARRLGRIMRGQALEAAKQPLTEPLTKVAPDTPVTASAVAPVQVVPFDRGKPVAPSNIPILEDLLSVDIPRMPTGVPLHGPYPARQLSGLTESLRQRYNASLQPGQAALGAGELPAPVYAGESPPGPIGRIIESQKTGFDIARTVIGGVAAPAIAGPEMLVKAATKALSRGIDLYYGTAPDKEPFFQDLIAEMQQRMA